jgi:hypothetical protein
LWLSRRKIMRDLTDREVEQVSGGGVEVNWGMLTTGLAMIGLGVAIASTSGLATVAVPLILGAGTFAEIGVGVVSVGFAGGGSILSGSAISFGGGNEVGGGVGGGSDPDPGH